MEIIQIGVGSSLGHGGGEPRGNVARQMICHRKARSEIARFDADRGIERLSNQIEDTIDDLEQAAFAASLFLLSCHPPSSIR